MGNNEINGYLINEVLFPYYSRRTLSVQSSEHKKSFFGKLSEFGMDIAMIIAPLLTYCFQINKFHKTKSSKGFSKLICFLLFLGNIFRIFFWIGTHFKKTLLYQSIGVVIFQVILIHLCVKYQDNPIQKNFITEMSNNNEINQDNNLNRNLLYYLTHWKETFSLSKIWKWEYEIEYYKFMFFIIVNLLILSEIFHNSKIFFHIIGILSGVFESMTCVPQVIENYKTKNTSNVSFLMIFCWFLGDSFRLYYNIKFKAPLQMIAAISFQVFLDIVVCCQICIYRRISPNPIDFSLTKQKKKEEIDTIMQKIDEMNIYASKKENGEEINSNLNKKEGDKNEEKGDQNNTSDPENVLK